MGPFSQSECAWKKPRMQPEWHPFLVYSALILIRANRALIKGSALQSAYGGEKGALQSAYISDKGE